MIFAASSTSSGLFSYALAVQGAEFPVPCGCQVLKTGERGAGVIGPPCLNPFVPKYFRPDSVWAVSMPEFRNSKAGDTAAAEFGLGMRKRYFLFKREL